MATVSSAGPATGAERDVVLTVEGLTIVLDPSGRNIDDEVSLQIRQGEVLGLVGESASGKTTAATSLLAHQRRGAKISGGQITIDGRDVLSLAEDELRTIRGGLISYVPQDSSASLNPALRIGTQLMEILEAHDFGSSGSDREKRLAEMMAEVLLPSDHDFLRRYPHQLSGGQQQRVAIAMAFANRPKVIVLDEPTTALDVTTQAHVLDTIRDLTKRYGVAALYVTHDLAVVANLADRIAVMYAGRIVEIGTKEELFEAGQHPYTRKLLSSIPDITGERALKGIPGWAPRPGQRPPGCAFTPRCSWAVEKCSEEFPPVDGPTAEHRVRCWRWREVAAQAAETDVVLRDRSLDACAAADTTVISVRAVTAFYQSKETLHGIDASLCERRCLSLVGESGSGKTTLARCIAGLHQHKIVGDIEFMGKPLARDARDRPRATRQAIQYIFQSPYSSLNPRKTIRQVLAAPLEGLLRPLARRDGGAHGEGARAGGARRHPPQPLPGPALGRRAPAGGHRPRSRRRAHGPGLRRGHELARRQRAGGDHRAARQPAARNGPLDALRHPQPRPGALDQPGGRGHERGPHRRVRRRRRGPRGPAGRLHEEAAVRHADDLTSRGR